MPHPQLSVPWLFKQKTVRQTRIVKEACQIENLSDSVIVEPLIAGMKCSVEPCGISRHLNFPVST